MPETASITEFGLDDHPHRILSIVMSFRETISEDSTTGFGEAKRESFLGVTFVEEYAVKIRHTFVRSNDGDVDDQRRQSRDEVVNVILRAIKEADIRPAVVEAIKKLQVDPTDPDSAAIVVGIAEASQILQVTVASEWLPFPDDENFEHGTDLLASFVAGNIEAQFRKQSFESQNLAGVKRMVEAYKTLRKFEKCEKVDVLDQWSAEIEAGTFQLPLVESGESG